MDKFSLVTRPAKINYSRAFKSFCKQIITAMWCENCDNGFLLVPKVVSCDEKWDDVEIYDGENRFNRLVGQKFRLLSATRHYIKRDCRCLTGAFWWHDCSGTWIWFCGFFEIFEIFNVEFVQLFKLLGRKSLSSTASLISPKLWHEKRLKAAINRQKRVLIRGLAFAQH